MNPEGCREVNWNARASQVVNNRANKGTESWLCRTQLKNGYNVARSKNVGPDCEGLKYASE